MSRFKREAEEIRKLARYAPINVLVWGPGDPGENVSPEKHKAYKKRLKIKNHLKRKFPEAEIHFSEDEELKKLVHVGQNKLQAQAVQAKIAHLILMLDLGRGVDLELVSRQ